MAAVLKIKLIARKTSPSLALDRNALTVISRSQDFFGHRHHIFPVGTRSFRSGAPLKAEQRGPYPNADAFLKRKWREESPVEASSTSSSASQIQVASQSHTSQTLSDDAFTSPRLTVFGVGGAGGNAINTMIDESVAGVEFIVANTDAQALSRSKAPRKIQLGKRITKGLGAGAKLTVGREAAKESIDEIMKDIAHTQMLFVTAGLGGGTGTGAAPIIAEHAKNQGILTVAIVTTPFTFEGKKRMEAAEEGIAELEKAVDTLIVIPNQKLISVEEKHRYTWQESFKLVDSVLLNGVRGITDVLTIPGEINTDFADVRTIVQEGGRALLGTGVSDGRGRAKLAAQAALSNPLLEDVPIHGAKGCLINICSGPDLGLEEVDEIMSEVKRAIDEDANIILGSTFDQKMAGKVRVTLILTGMTKSAHRKQAALIADSVAKAKEQVQSASVSDASKLTWNSFKNDPWETIKRYW
eukprot:TRINITY_DN893_c0_g1_i4.p1 TRINITY_DN893_c0_g1~~TRINITY_DN893_c0_g1_i4.p1  ORF type:complete len:469 (+),score=76.27 TRINITY_DN893_c0_g1_i4:80-1486(+)